MQNTIAVAHVECMLRLDRVQLLLMFGLETLGFLLRRQLLLFQLGDGLFALFRNLESSGGTF